MLNNMLIRQAIGKIPQTTPELGTPEQERIKARLLDLAELAENLTAGSSHFVLQNLGLLRAILKPMQSMHAESLVKLLARISNTVLNTAYSEQEYNEAIAEIVGEIMNDGSECTH